MTSVTDRPTLRPFHPDDVPALHEIDVAFQREAGFGPPGAPYYHHDDYDNIEGVYLNAGGAFWVLEHANEVVAFGGVLRIDDTTARLRRFRVRADWRRRGLATLLLTKAERFCRERGYTTITLGTTDVQQAAQALYRKHGYVEVGEQWLRDDLREIEFAKELP